MTEKATNNETAVEIKNLRDELSMLQRIGNPTVETQEKISSVEVKLRQAREREVLANGAEYLRRNPGEDPDIMTD